MKEKYIYAVLMTGLVALLTIPAAAAQTTVTDPSINPKPTKKAGLSFCSSITTATNNTLTKMTALKTKRQAQRSNRVTTLAKKRANRDSIIAQNRAGIDTKLQQQFVTLAKDATTNEQQLAVKTFTTTVQQALTTKRQAVDAARTTFRTGVDQAIAKREPTISNAMVVFDASVNSAISKARSDCAAGMDSKTAKTTFHTAVKDARKKFTIDLANDAFKTSVGTLSQTRRQTIQNAQSPFRTTVQQAADSLNSVLGTATSAE